MLQPVSFSRSQITSFDIFGTKKIAPIAFAITFFASSNFMAAPLAAQTLPNVSYDDVQPFTVPNVVFEEPKDYTTGPLNDPIIFLIVAALVFSAFAYRALMQKPCSQDKVGGLAGLAGGSVGFAVYWPQVFGQSLPFAALNDISQSRFWEFFQTPFIAAAVLGVAALIVGAYAASMANGEITFQTTKPTTVSEPRRAYPLKAGDRIKVYKGYEIHKAEEGVVVNGESYSGLLAAEKAISAMVTSER